MFRKNHVGRPSNEEIRNKKVMRILSYGIPSLLLIIAIILLSSTNLTELSGNSVTSYHCTDSNYTLNGNKCIRIVKEKALLIGDINNDNNVSTVDMGLILSKIKGNTVLNEFQLAAADINKDGEVDDQDYQIIKMYVAKENISENMGSYKIGEERICPRDYEETNGYCVKEYVVAAQKSVAETAVSNTFTIRFNANGGTGSMQDQKVTYGKSVKLNANKFMKTGYVFVGWRIYNNSRNKWACYDQKGSPGYKDESYCKKYGYVVYNDNVSVAKTANIGEVLTFYAQWSNNNKYKIEFNANGGTGSMNSITPKHGTNVTTPANAYSHSGYSFVGWRVYNKTLGKWSCYKDSSKNSTKWSTVDECKKYGYVLRANKTIVNHTVSVGQTAVFYAQWQYNYKNTKSSFNGFEKDPKGATVWPMVKINFYKSVTSGGTKGSGNIGTIPQGTALKVIDMTNKTNEKNSFVKVSYGGKTGYINGWLTMINLPDIIPSALYNITNAKASIYKTRGNNLSGVTGYDIYGTGWNSGMAPIRIETAKKIQKAETTALKYGNRIKIYDSFRPWTVQRKIANAVKTNWFNGKTYCISKEFDYSKNTNGRSVNCVTDSKGWFIAIAASNPSSHNIAKAIDVTLVTSDDNQEIATQTKMHELSGNSIPTSTAISKYRGELALNYLFTNAGFYFLPSEWWHFEDVSNTGYSSYYSQIKCLGNPMANNSYNCKVNQLKLAK